jgi:hypothetical protein
MDMPEDEVSSGIWVKGYVSPESVLQDARMGRDGGWVAVIIILFYRWILLQWPDDKLIVRRISANIASRGGRLLGLCCAVLYRLSVL